MKYNNIDSFSKKALYFQSNHKGLGTRPFDKQKKFRVNYWKLD